MSCNNNRTCICETTIHSEISNKRQKGIPEIFKTIFSLGILQLLRNSKLKAFNIQDHNKTNFPLNNYTNGRETQTALLEAEHKKSTGLMEWQRRGIL